MNLDPNNLLEAHLYYGIMLHGLGRMPEALAKIERERARDPLSSTLESHYGRVLYRARRYEDALPHLQRAIGLLEKGAAAAAEGRGIGPAAAGNSEAIARLYALMGRRQSLTGENWSSSPKPSRSSTVCGPTRAGRPCCDGST